MSEVTRIFAKARIKYKNRTAEEWATENPVLLDGEPGFVSDVNENEWFKVGDGVTPWNELPWKKGPQGEQGLQGDAGKDVIIDTKYNPESDNAQSGKAVAEGIEGSVGDINSVLGAVVEGSSVLPSSLISKVIEKAAAGVETKLGNRFITAVAVKDTENIEIEPNAAYFVLSNTETGKITVFDRITEEPIEFTGKMIGLITGNYGDSNPSSVLGFVGIYSSAVITKGTYLALKSSKTASLSWEGEATLIMVKNVKGE